MSKSLITSTALALSAATMAQAGALMAFAFEMPGNEQAAGQNAAFTDCDDPQVQLDEDDHLDWDSGFPVGPILDDRVIPSK